MNPRRIAALAFRIVLQFRRDRRTVGFLVVVPVVVLSLLAYLINLAPGALHLGVVREDPSPFAQRLVDELKQSPGLDIREVSRQEAGELAIEDVEDLRQRR